MKVTVIIPVYNEKDNIETVIDIVKSTGIAREIIIVDDFSTDGTRNLVKSRKDIKESIGEVKNKEETAEKLSAIIGFEKEMVLEKLQGENLSVPATIDVGEFSCFLGHGAYYPSHFVIHSVFIISEFGRLQAPSVDAVKSFKIVVKCFT